MMTQNYGLSVKQVASLYQVHPGTVLRWVHARRIRYDRFGPRGRISIPFSALSDEAKSFFLKKMGVTGASLGKKT